MTTRPRKNRFDTITAYVYREDAAGEEQEIEVEFDAQWEGADPSVGAGGGVFLDGARRTDDGTPIEVTKAEVERFTEQAERNRRDCDEDLRADAAEARAEALADR